MRTLWSIEDKCYFNHWSYLIPSPTLTERFGQHLKSLWLIGKDLLESSVKLETQKIFDAIAGGNVADSGIFASSEDSCRQEKDLKTIKFKLKYWQKT